MASNIPVIVQGNSFSLAIPLQIYYINGDQMDLQDYTPVPTDEVSVQLKGSRRNYTYTPTIDGNVANIDLTGNELADNYGVVVSIVKANGQRLRSFRTDQFFIVESSDDLTPDDIIEGLEENVIYLNSSIFVAGEDGRGIESIVKTSTSGLVDTYTITYTDATTSTFAVTNGAQGEQGVGIATIAKTSTSGKTDTYTITLTNGQTSTFEVTNGMDGVDLGLANIVNDLTTGGATNVLSAEMGKVLAKNVALIVENLANIAFIGNRPAFEDMGVGTQYQVAYDLTNVTSSNDATTASKGFPFETILTHSAGTSLTINVTMGGVDITSQCYDDSTKKITIEQVTGNISITASASQEVNTMYKGVRYQGYSGQYALLEVGENELFVISPLIDLGADRSAAKSISFSVGTANSDYALFGFDSNGDYWSYYEANAAPRTVSLATTWRYIRLLMPSSAIASSYIYDDDAQEYLWNGADHSISEAQDHKAFMSSPYCPQPNANGDYVGWLYLKPNTTVNVGYLSIIQKSTVVKDARITTNASMGTIIGYGKSGHEFAWVVGKTVQMPAVDSGTGKRKISYGAGTTQESGAWLPILQIFTIANGVESSRNFSGLASTDSGMVDGVRTAEFGENRNYCAMICPTSTYNDQTNQKVYIKDYNNNTIIWSNQDGDD